MGLEEDDQGDVDFEGKREESRVKTKINVWISGIRGRRERKKRGEPEGGGSESQKERKEGLPSSTKTLCITLASLRNSRLFA